MRDDAGRDRAQVCAQRRATVEAKPTDPEKHGSYDHMSDVMWAIRQAVQVTVAAPLAEHDRVREGSGAGRDVHRGSSCKI